MSNTLYLTDKDTNDMERKESVSYSVGSYQDDGFLAFLNGDDAAKWVNFTYEQAVKEAYEKCVVAYKCVQLRSDAMAHLKWCLYDKNGDEIDRHPLLDLLRRPDLNTGGSAFIKELQIYKDVDGNAFLHQIGGSSIKGLRPPKRLELFRPDCVEVIPGRYGLPAAYVYKTNQNETHYPVDQANGRSDILHIKNVNPMNKFRGTGLMKAAWQSIQVWNEGSDHTKKSLEQGARLSGVLSTDQNLTREQVEMLEGKLSEKYYGSKNSGKILIASGGMKYNVMAQTMKDLEFINSRNVTAREIATAFGVPPILLNVGEGATYANMKEARMDFYESTMLPEMWNLRDELNHWLVPMFGEDLYLDVDLDEIVALEPKREAKWERVQNATFLTLNEKREILGFEPIDGGDTIQGASMRPEPQEEPEEELPVDVEEQPAEETDND